MRIAGNIKMRLCDYNIGWFQDCLAICGTVVDHKLLSSDEIQQRYEQSVSTWNEFCPTEPYDFLSSPSTAANTDNTNLTSTYQQKSSYDIAGAVQRQRNFNYQVEMVFTSFLSFFRK